VNKFEVLRNAKESWEKGIESLRQILAYEGIPETEAVFVSLFAFLPGYQGPYDDDFYSDVLGIAREAAGRGAVPAPGLEAAPEGDAS
jgi:hypothetical protein